MTPDDQAAEPTLPSSPASPDGKPLNIKGRGKKGKNGIQKSASIAVRAYKKPERPVTNKQIAFFENYRKHHNAKLAAIEAGYSVNGAKQAGSRLLTDVDLQQRINSYGQLGLDILADIAFDNSYDERARVQAANALIERAYGKPKDNSASKDKPPITINFNKIEVTGKQIGTVTQPNRDGVGDSSNSLST